MREPDEKKRSTNGIPRLYQKYIGHDDNRDFYMMNMSESVNANKMMYREWYPGDHVQPSPDRAGRRGAVRAAVPRSVQLQLRSAGPARHRHGRRRDPHAAGGRRQARRGDAERRALLDLVQRRHPHHVVLPQPDRHPDRDHRQPDAGRDPVRARHAAAARRRAQPDRAAGMALPAVDRVLDHEQLRHSRHRVEASRGLPLQHVQDGEERHRQGQPRQLDDSSEADRGGSRRRSRPRQAGASRGGEDIGPRGGRGGGFGARRRAGRDLQHGAARSEDARSARLHPPVGSAGLPDRDQVRQHPDQRPASSSTARSGVHRRRQGVSAPDPTW